MKPIVFIDFACNDPDNGLFAGRAGQANYGPDNIEIESPNWLDGYKFTELKRGRQALIRIHRRTFEYVDSREWLGNWCWNRYWLRRDEMKRLLMTLRDNGWRVSCGPHVFFDWWNGREV